MENFPKLDAQSAVKFQEVVHSLVFPAKEFKRGGHLPGPQPMTLDRSKLEIVRQNAYFILEKSDGERIMMLVHDNGVYLLNRSFEISQVDCSIFLSSLGAGGPTLLDGELIHGLDGVLLYLVYDIVSLCGTRVGHLHLEERIAHMEQAVLRCAAAHQAAGSNVHLPYTLKVKTFLPKTQIHKHLNRISRASDGSYIHQDPERNLRNSNDGLIFTPVERPYLNSEYLFKWKWPDLNSIDFTVFWPYVDRDNFMDLYSRAKTRNAGSHDVLAQRIYVDEGTRSWIESVLPIGNGKSAVVECLFDPNLSLWLVKKYRPDKKNSNFLSITVISTLQCVIENVTDREVCLTCGCEDPNCGMSYRSQLQHTLPRSLENVEDMSCAPRRRSAMQIDEEDLSGDDGLSFLHTEFTPCPPE